MAYGMKIYNPDNTLAYDSTSPGGTFVQYILMPPTGTVSSTNPATVNFPLDWAPGEYIPGGPQRGRTITIQPLVIGSHKWLFSSGYYQSGQVPSLSWYDDPYLPPGISRAQSILMVFVK